MITPIGDDPSLSRLESEAARNRANLIDTVDELQNRVSPTAIKRDIEDYVRDKKDGLFRGLEEKARENPLQAVAIGAGVAYPLLRLAAGIPAPFLLIAAGFALTRRGAVTDRYLQQARDMVSGAAESVTHKFHDATDSVTHKLNDVSDALNRKLHDASDSVNEAGRAVQGAASQAAGTVAGMASQATDYSKKLIGDASATAADGAAVVGGAGADLASASRDVVSSAYRTGLNSATAARDQIAYGGRRTQESLLTAMQNNPLIAGAIGVAIGAAIAAAIPTTRSEERLLGKPSEGLKNAAQAMASESLGTVRRAALEVFDEAVKGAADQGLSSEGLKQAASEVGDKVKTVVAEATGATPSGSSS